MESLPKRDRTSLVLVAGFLLVALFAVVLWNQRAPLNSVDQDAIYSVASQLHSERFVTTNLMRFHDETLLGPLPIPKLFGMSKDWMTMPLVRDGAMLSITCETKRGRAFNISIAADPILTRRAHEIAAELLKTNQRLSVTVTTNASLTAGQRGNR